MQCLILAGGLGTRMQKISGEKPKALLPIGQETFIDFQLKWLKMLGVSDVVLAIGHRSEMIESHIESRQSQAAYPQVNYSYDGDQLLGTGGAIRKAQRMLSKNFIVTYGDSFLLLNVKQMVAQHLTRQAHATMSIMRNEDKGDTSNVIFENGKITLYTKKEKRPEMKHIDYGMLVINKAHFLQRSPEGKFDLADYLSGLSTTGELDGFEVTEKFYETGSPEGYQGLQNFLKQYDYDLKKLKTKYQDLF